MPQYTFQVLHYGDSPLPRHVVVNTLHFNDHGAGTDPGGLAEDLLGVFKANWDTSPPDRKMEVRVYDMGDEIPREPVAVKTRDAGMPSSAIPREIALCLSFYAGRNLPRSRGRIYLPAFCSITSAGVRPNASQRANALALAQGFANLGGPDVDWIVRSRVGDQSQPVTNAWCDDEWDTQRRRGLQSTTRDLLSTHP